MQNGMMLEIKSIWEESDKDENNNAIQGEFYPKTTRTVT